jgi:hypothetical protein
MLQAVLAATLVGVACSDDVTAPVRSFDATLAGANEVPAVVSTAGATGTFQLVGGASGEDSVSYTITMTSATGTAVTQAHIHTGAIGATGNVSVWLCKTAAVTGFPAGTPDCTAGGVGVLVTGKMAVTPAVVASMRTFGTYANVHTTANLTGEIRGQLRVVE